MHDDDHRLTAEYLLRQNERLAAVVIDLMSHLNVREHRMSVHRADLMSPHKLALHVERQTLVVRIPETGGGS